MKTLRERKKQHSCEDIFADIGVEAVIEGFIAELHSVLRTISTHFEEHRRIAETDSDSLVLLTNSETEDEEQEPSEKKQRIE